MSYTIEDLDRIAIDVSVSRHGDFLRSFALAWQLADPENKDLMLVAWVSLIGKYGLDEEGKLRAQGGET